MGGGRKFVLDISAILSGALESQRAYELIQLGKFYIPWTVVAKLRDMLSRKLEDGMVGLNSLNKLRERGAEIEIVNVDKQASEDLAALELARKLGAVLVTSDRVMAKLASIYGVEAELVLPNGMESRRSLRIREYFDDETLSVHLKEGVPPMAKKGTPGNWKLVKIGDQPMGKAELEQIIREVIEEARKPDSGGFIEIERPSSTIVQLGDLRIVVTKPPFSDAIEVTAVRPIKRLRIEDYNLPEKLLNRLRTKAEGILIAGPPGHGKTTFAQALAEFYKDMGKIVKTIEAPRDMVLSRGITSYSKNYGTPEEIRDIILLSRPDYTIFDEMRNPEDFKLFADLRLAGVGMVGVVHATSAMDAVQRFFDKVDLGVIPSIIDTVIFMKFGKVDRVLALKTTVKVPHGLQSEDLARPVVVVYDFLTGKPMYECYTFGERTFVVPVSPEARRELYGAEEVAQPSGEEAPAGRREVPYVVRLRKRTIVFDFGRAMAGRTVVAYLGTKFLFEDVVSRSGLVKLDMKSKLGKTVRKALENGGRLVFYEGGA